MNDTQITLQGWLGGRVTTRDAGGSPVATFRVATTPRRYSRKIGQWVDGDTQWYTVKAWRGLADNCARSLDRGDPVVVQGRLEARSYVNANGVEVFDLEVEATAVGHDLNRGTSRFTKTVRADARPSAATVPTDAPDRVEPLRAVPAPADPQEEVVSATG